MILSLHMQASLNLGTEILPLRGDSGLIECLEYVAFNSGRGVLPRSFSLGVVRTTCLAGCNATREKYC